MPRRSETRIKIENALELAGCNVSDNVAFTDKSKSGWRIKYAFVTANNKSLSAIRAQLRKQFPNNDFRVWNVKPANKFSNFGGLGIKIFNN